MGLKGALTFFSINPYQLTFTSHLWSFISFAPNSKNKKPNTIANSFPRIFLKQLPQQIFKFLRNPNRNFNNPKFNFFKKLLPITFIKGWFPCYHLHNNTAQTPPIHLFSIALFQEYFWGQVFRSAAEGHCIPVGLHAHFGKPEIGYTDVPVRIY